LFVALTLTALVIGSLGPLGLFLGPMVCGLFACMLAELDGEEPSFPRLFGGFRFFVPSFVVTLLSIVPMMAPSIPLNMLAALLFVRRLLVWMGRPYSVMAAMLGMTETIVIIAIVTALVFVLGVVLGAFFMFAYPLVAERQLGGVAAVRLSASVARANLGDLLRLMAATTGLSLAASFAVCYLGGVFVMPIVLATWTIAYRHYFPRTAVTI
jgi:hypothetical protein